MMKDFTISNMLDLNETIAAELFEGKTYPWEVLPEIGDFIIKLGKTLDAGRLIEGVQERVRQEAAKRRKKKTTGKASG